MPSAFAARALAPAWLLASAFEVLAELQFFDPVTQSPPGTLGALGVYADISAKHVDPALKFFEVNSALWSDGAAKHRWLVLPAGASIAYNDTTDAFDYPERAMFVKNFYLDSVAGDTASRRYWETRVLVNKHDANGFDRWHGFTYKWRRDQGDADLVSSASGYDTVFHYRSGGTQTYKKWSFPRQEACVMCHKQGTKDDGAGPYGARGVLGFFPAQLKRVAPRQPSTNQVLWLFDQGVFTGTRPDAMQLAARWKGLSEPIPPGLNADQRFRVIDSMARSFLAANCSGCHSRRNIGLPVTPKGLELNFDWHRLAPQTEFGAVSVGTYGVDEPENDAGPLPNFDLSESRTKYVYAVGRSGLAGEPFWTMTLPGAQVPRTIITPGFPAASMVLYRQFGMRRTPWRDSLTLRFRLEEADPGNLKTWIFNAPWGSAAWRADLASHGIKVDSLFRAHLLFEPEAAFQMPPLASHIPDTAAMRLLGEWAGTYRTLVPVNGYPVVSRVAGESAPSAREALPVLRGRVLTVPRDWRGPARMTGLDGRGRALPSAGAGRFVVPASAPPGVYAFKVGARVFRAMVH
jgi:hypothetical protein